MSETGDTFNALKKVRQEKRAANREASAAILSRSGIVFESKNIGAHLIVFAGTKTVDFWPGTGKWIVRGEPREDHRGVRKLVEYVENQRAKGDK